MLRQQNAAAISTQASDRQMMKFTETIRLEIEVQAIADLLLKQFPEDYKHRELVTEAIIATSQHNGSIGYVYNALCGFTPNINFQVGDRVMCSARERRVNEFEIQAIGVDQDPKEAKQVYKNYEFEEIEECEVVEIDFYRGDKLKVRYMQDKFRSTDQEETTAWVNHKKCEKLAEITH